MLTQQLRTSRDGGMAEDGLPVNVTPLKVLSLPSLQVQEYKY